MPSASSSVKPRLPNNVDDRKQSTDSTTANNTAGCGSSSTTTMGMDNPLRMGITFIEHKIRNLDKRKQKLDSYKQEQSQGKELNNDQLSAVSKYTEVVQQMEFAKEIEKQFTQFLNDYLKLTKKQQKKEQLDRSSADADRFRQAIIIQVILRQFSSPQVRNDLKEGLNGAVKLTDEQLAALDELSQVASMDLALHDQTKLAATSEKLINLIDEKMKPVVGDVTYKDAKTLILALSASDYFDPTKTQEHDFEEKSEQSEEVSFQPPTNPSVQNFEEHPTKPIIITDTRESSYGFLQETSIDIESDPAVVAVSSYPPPMMTQINDTNTSNMFNAMDDQPGLMRPSVGPGSQIEDLNLNNLTVKEGDADYNEWVNPEDARQSNQDWSSAQDKSNDMDNSHENDRGRRGGGNRGSGFRGGRGSRGVTNNGYRGASGPGRFPTQNGKNGNYGGGGYERRGDRYERGDGDNHFGGEFKAPRPRGGGSGSFNNRNDSSYGGNRYGGPARGVSQHRGAGSFRGNPDGNGMYQH